MRIRETFVNASKGYRYGDGDWYEPYTEDRGELFRNLRREYGKCISKMYVELPTVDDGSLTAYECGWVFQSRVKYDDSPDTYLRETWVEVQPITNRA
jgi:hypothetical protein